MRWEAGMDCKGWVSLARTPFSTERSSFSLHKSEICFRQYHATVDNKILLLSICACWPLSHLLNYGSEKKKWAWGERNRHVESRGGNKNLLNVWQPHEEKKKWRKINDAYRVLLFNSYECFLFKIIFLSATQGHCFVGGRWSFVGKQETREA